MVIKSLGYELEVSKERFLVSISPKEYYKESKLGITGKKESSYITEFHLSPVKFKNERNTIRRFACNLITGGLNIESLDTYGQDFFFQGIPLNIERNFKGTYTRKGESGHFHIKLDTNQDDKLVKILIALSPLFSRRSSFRKTIKRRAKINRGIYRNTKIYSYCYNTEFGTYEIRINESLIFPVISALIIDAYISSTTPPQLNANDIIYRTLKTKTRITITEREIIKPMLETLVDFTIEHVNNNRSSFSARGRYYLKLLQIFKENLRYYVRFPKNFEISIAEDMLSWLYVKDRKFRYYVDNIYVPFVTEYLNNTELRNCQNANEIINTLGFIHEDAGYLRM